MSNRNENEKNIKAKVFLSYALILILISSIVFFAFNSFQKLTHSADALAQPNPRIGLLHDIIISIYHAESNIRAYSLNEDESHLDTYFTALSDINHRVDSLYVLAESDAYFIQTLDSINEELLAKTRLLEQFIQIRRLDKNSVFYERALDEIIQVAEEEIKIREVTHQTITDSIPADVAETEHHETKQETENFFSRIRAFFSGSREEEQKEKERTTDENLRAQQMLQQIRTDSVITIYRDTQNLKQDIESTMLALMENMFEQQQRLVRMENQILIEDKKVMDNIWKFITRLEDYESASNLIEAEKAHATVKSTTRKIFFLILFSILVLLAFSWLFVNDVNKSKYYKKQLLREKSRAEQLLQIKQRFMANISHEIRTPLNSIIGFSRQLEKIVPDQKPQKYIEAVNQSSVHLLEIVNDILDFSKIEAGKIKLEIIPFNIREVAEEVYNTLSVIATEKDLAFDIDTSGLKIPMVMGDPLRIKQVLINIAGNAIKFTEKGSVKIDISDYVNEKNADISHVKMRVSDTGIGISALEQEQIFEEFAQIDSRAARKHGGTGLGLSISKKLTRLMNGSIEVFSKPSEGSTFTVHLPLALAGKPIPEKVQPPLPLPAKLRARLLLVDDDRLNRLLVQSILESVEGIIVNEAESAKEALAILEKQKFDLIITDIQMPEMTGIEMIRKLKEKPGYLNQTTPVLACTADITPETIREVREAGIADYLLKPFDETGLMKKLRKLLAGKPESGTHTENRREKYPGGKLVKPSSAAHIKSYDLQGLLSFTGDKPDALVSVMDVFIADTSANIEKLENSLVSKDFDTIYRVSHKMSNMFGLLKAQPIILHLQKLNRIGSAKVSEKEICESTAQIIELGKVFIVELSKDIQEIRSEMSKVPQN